MKVCLIPDYYDPETGNSITNCIMASGDPSEWTPEERQIYEEWMDNRDRPETLH